MPCRIMVFYTHSLQQSTLGVHGDYEEVIRRSNPVSSLPMPPVISVGQGARGCGVMLCGWQVREPVAIVNRFTLLFFSTTMG